MGQSVPKQPLRLSEEKAREADLAICLGSSLTVSPFCDLPALSKQMVIVTRQKTMFDRKAAVVAHCDIDKIMHLMMQKKGLSLNVFTYRQPFIIRREEVRTEYADKAVLTLVSPWVNEGPMFIDDKSHVLIGETAYDIAKSGISYSTTIATTDIPRDLDWIVVIHFLPGFNESPMQVNIGPYTSETVEQAHEFTKQVHHREH